MAIQRFKVHTSSAKPFSARIFSVPSPGRRLACPKSPAEERTTDVNHRQPRSPFSPMRYVLSLPISFFCPVTEPFLDINTPHLPRLPSSSTSSYRLQSPPISFSLLVLLPSATNVEERKKLMIGKRRYCLGEEGKRNGH